MGRWKATVLLSLILAGCLSAGNQPSPTAPTSSEPTPAPMVREQDDPYWPMLRGGPAHLGSRGSPPAMPARLLWNITLEGQRYDVAQDLAIVNGSLIATRSPGQSYRINPQTGELYEQLNQSLCCEPIWNGQYVFLHQSGPGGASIVAMDVELQRVVWRFTRSFALYPVTAVADGIVYVGSESAYVFALDAQTGRLVWQSEVSDPSVCRPFSPPVVSDGHVYVGSGCQRLWKLDAGTGEVVWSFKSVAGVVTPAAIGRGIVLVATNSPPRDLLALYNSNGTIKWLYRIFADIPHAPVMANDTVYLYAWDNYVHAVDLQTGKAKWHFPTGNLTSCAFVRFCVKDNPSPVYAEGVLVVPGLDGKLYALRGEDGKVLWEEPVGGQDRSSVLVWDKTFYMAVDHNLLAFGAR